jgi:hypothetical protein
MTNTGEEESTPAMNNPFPFRAGGASEGDTTGKIGKKEQNVFLANHLRLLRQAVKNWRNQSKVESAGQAFQRQVFSTVSFGLHEIAQSYQQLATEQLVFARGYFRALTQLRVLMGRRLVEVDRTLASRMKGDLETTAQIAQQHMFGYQSHAVRIKNAIQIKSGSAQVVLNATKRTKALGDAATLLSDSAVSVVNAVDSPMQALLLRVCEGLLGASYSKFFGVLMRDTPVGVPLGGASAQVGRYLSNVMSSCAPLVASISAYAISGDSESLRAVTREQASRSLGRLAEADPRLLTLQDFRKLMEFGEEAGNGDSSELARLGDALSEVLFAPYRHHRVL